MTVLAAIIGAAGIPCLLVGRAWGIRRAGLGAILVAWLLFAAALAPGGAWTGAVVLGVLPAAAALGRFTGRHIHVWLGLVGATLALRVPLSLGGEDARLLVPLYVVILGGVSARYGGRSTSARGDHHGALGPLLPALAAFAGFATLSVAWSADPTAGAIRAAAFFLPFTLLFWLLVELWPEQGGVRALATGGLGFAVLASLVAVLQGALGVTFANGKLAELHAAGGVFRANAFLFDPNTLGRTLAVGLVGLVGAGYVVARRGGRLTPLAAIGAVLAVGLALTVSQSSGLALASGLVVLLARVYGWRSVAAVAALGAALLVVWATLGADPVRDSVASRERIARASDGRDHLVAGGVAVWRGAPAVGVGTGGFAASYAETLTADERRHATVFVSHTAPVTVLAELGLVGIGLLAWLAAAAWRVLSDRRRPGAWTRAVIGAMLAGVVVHSLLTGALLEDPIVWALLAAGCAAAARPHPGQLAIEATPVQVQSLRVPNPVVLGLVAVAASSHRARVWARRPSPSPSIPRWWARASVAVTVETDDPAPRRPTWRAPG